MQISQLSPETNIEIERANAAVSKRAKDWYGKKLKGKHDDLDLMQRMFDDGRVGLAHIHEVLELGMVLGTVLSKTQKWNWVLVELDGGEQQLRLAARPATAVAEAELVDPLALILDPVEAGQSVRVREIYDSVISRNPKR
jgi:hypothetical protein